MGQKREKLCEHRNVFERPLRSKGPTAPRKPRRTMKQSQPKRDWSAARAKVELEGRCRICGGERFLQAAHITGRKYDRPAFEGAKTLYVDPDCIVPLCANEQDGFNPGCHQRYDWRELDLLPHLTAEEQSRAVLDAGSIESARRRLCPSAYNSEREVAG